VPLERTGMKFIELFTTKSVDQILGDFKKMIKDLEQVVKVKDEMAGQFKKIADAAMKKRTEAYDEAARAEKIAKKLRALIEE
jgi:ElaB/YqjD/DUF883 family membrane-anchored ribosome-binding protein